MYVCVDTILTHVRRCLSFRPSWLFGKAQLLYSLETSFPLYNRRRRIDGKSKMERKYERGGGRTENEKMEVTSEQEERRKKKERKMIRARICRTCTHSPACERVYTHTRTHRENIYMIYVCIYIYIYKSIRMRGFSPHARQLN